MKTQNRRLNRRFISGLFLIFVIFFLITITGSAQISISGPDHVCSAETGIVYVATGGTLTYTWTISPDSGGTITAGGGTNSVTIDWGNTPQTVVITVNATGGTPSGTASKTVTVNARPTPEITGTDSICQGTTGIVYFTEPGMTNYTWNIAPPVSFTTGPVTNAITVNWIDAGTFTMTVNYTNSSGCTASPAATRSITVNQAAVPVIGPVGNTACTGTIMTYTTAPLKNNYVWTLTSGGTIVSGNGTNSIRVNWINVGTHTITVTYTEPGTNCWALIPGIKAVTVSQSPDPVIDGPDTVCSNGTYTYSTDPGKSMYSWTVGAGGTIMSGGGTSTVTVRFPQAGNTTVSVNYTDPSNGCQGVAAAIKNVKVVQSPTVEAISNQYYCHESHVPATPVTGPVPGTTFFWSNSQPLIGLPESGTGNVSPFTASNTTTLPVSGIITIQPVANECPGSTTSYTVTINPKPSVNSEVSQVVCNGDLTDAVVFSGTVTGTVYQWTNSQPSIGLNPEGFDSIPSFAASNTGTITVTAVITVTPKYSNGGINCYGTPMTFTITVQPSPSVTSISNQTHCPGEEVPFTSVSGPVAGTNFTWVNSNPLIGLSGSGTGDVSPFTASNTTTLPVSGVITIQSVANGCPGSTTSYTVTINPTPSVHSEVSQVVCHGDLTDAVVFSGTVTGTVYQWSNSQPSIGLNPEGFDSIPSFAASNTGTITVSAVITVTPVYSNGGESCSGASTTFTITVTPRLEAGSLTASQTVCFGINPEILTATKLVGGSLPYGYEWESSANGIEFTTIPGASGLTYQPGPVTADRWYRVRQSSSSGCGSVYTNQVKISVNALPVIGISGPAAACYNSTNNVYTAVPGMTNYQWGVVGGTITAGGTTTSTSATVTWNTLGSQQVALNYTTADGCTALTPATKTVTVQNIIIPNIDGPNPACTQVPSIYYTESNMLQYHWELPLGGGLIVSGQGTNQINVIWSSPGNRSVNVIYSDALGCTTLTPTVESITVNASPNPTIEGTTTICQGSAGVVYFTETGMAEYTWIVQGGTITGGQGTSAIAVTWTTAGTQSVTVNYTNLSGCHAPQPAVKQVTVQPAAVPVISGQTPVCTGTTTYYSTAAGMTNYIWNLDAGGTIISGSGTNTIGIRWSSVGTFNISVTYLNAQGCPTLVPGSKMIQVYQSPLPVITGADTVCLNGTVVFSTDPGMAMYDWTVSSGGLITSGQGTNSVAVKWIQSGPGTVSVNYVNPMGGCQAVTPTVKNITVYAPPVPVISGPQYGCTGGPGSEFYTAAGMSDYIWSASADGVITTGSGTNSVTVYWNTAGLQSVSVIYTDQHGCTAAIPSQFNLAINARPPTPIITGTAGTCPGTRATYTTQPGMIQYQWTISTGGTIITTPSAYSNTIEVLWHTLGSQWVSVNYQNTAGCLATLPATYSVTVHPLPVPTLTGPATTCQGADDNTFFTQAGQNNYTWFVSPDGTVTGGGTTESDFITVTWNTTGLKQVGINYTTTNGCTAAVATTHTVTVNSLPVPVITGASSGCLNTTGNVYFTEPGMTSYFWTVTSEGIITSGQGTRSVTITWLNHGNPIITVNYLNENGCQASVATPLMVAVHPAPTPSITSFSDPTDLVCQNTGGHIYFTGPGMSSYSWTVTGPSGTQILSGGAQSTCNIFWGGPGPAQGTLRVLVTNGYGCSASSPLKTVNITQPVVVGASIVVSQNPVLTGTAVTFTASTVNGGTNPVYQWRVNGIIAGTNSPTFTYVPSENDSIVCTVTSNFYCVVNPQATSNLIVMGILYGVPCQGIPTVTYMGKTYHTVQIGNQCWFKENLDAGTRINGNQEQTSNGIIEKYCYLDLESNCSVYGGLYQWNELMQYVALPGVQGICPSGWHIPTDEEWSVLTSYLGGESVAGGKMKEVGTTHWSSPNAGAVNTSGFTGLGAGLRFTNGTFGNFKEFGYFYSSTQNSTTNAWTRFLAGSLTGAGRNPNNKSLGLAVRCLKDTCSNYPPVSVSITPSTNMICAGTLVTFTAHPVNGGTNPAYQWRVNGSDVGTNQAVFSYVPAANDVVTCVLTSSLPSPCLSGNPATSGPVAMVVYPLPVPLLTGPVNVCPGVGGMVYNTESGMSGYTWSVSTGGTITGGQNTNSIFVTWNTPGVQTVTVTYLNQHGCAPATPTMKTVYVNPLVIPTISGSSQVCLDQAATYATQAGMSLYNWSVGSGGTITSGIGTATIQVRWNQPGFRMVMVNYANPQTGCQALTPAAFPVTVSPLPAPVITGPSSVCEGSPGVVYYTDPGMTNYNWIISSGGTITAGNGTQTVTVSWITSGTQTLTVNYTNTLGCQAANQTVKNVAVNPLPVPSINGSLNPCTGGVFNYTTEAGMSQYSWSVTQGGTILSGENTNSVFVRWNTTGSQSVAVGYRDVQGCPTAIPTVLPVSVSTPPVPTIAGPSSPCASSAVMYSTEAGMSNYQWTILPGGIITGGQGTSAITVVWQTPGFSGLTVNYTTPGGCKAEFPTPKTVTVLPIPAPVITGPSVITVGSTVLYTADAGMISYHWSVSAGGIIIGGAGTQAIQVSWGATGNQNVSLEVVNASGCHTVAPVVYAVKVLPPAVVTVQNIQIGPGQNECYDAVQTITVAGYGTYFIVHSGGAATFIAGKNILFLPGTTVEQGGSLHGYITTNGIYCGMSAPTMVTVPTAVEPPLTEIPVSKFKIYPNPTTGIFNIEYSGNDFDKGSRIEIYSMRGERILSEKLSNGRDCKVSIGGYPGGIYILRILSGEEVHIFRIVKQ